MKILIHDYAGHPFQVQLSRELARRGHDVLHLYYGNNNTPKGNLENRESDPRTFKVDGVYTKGRVQKYSFIKRWLQDIEYGNLIAARIKKFKPDLVLSANTPLDAQKKIIRTCQETKSKFVFWLQDVSGLAAYKLLSRKLPVIGALIGWYYIQIEKSMLQQSDEVILISEGFRSIVEKWGVKPEAIKVIPNWAPLDEIPVRKKDNPWSIEHDLENKFCFLYTGGIGLKHNPGLLLQLAQRFEQNENIRIVVVSEGPGATWLKEMKDKFGLPNLIVLGYQPFKQMPEVLASGNVLVAILEPDAGLFSVPSKVLSYLCAQRPLLLTVPMNNLAAKIVIENDMGLVTRPENAEGFLDAAERLFLDSTLRKKFALNSRMYAQRVFDINKIGDRFETSLFQGAG